MKHSPALSRLIDALHALPGIGPKSAQRLAFRLLQDERGAAQELSEAVTVALERVGRCGRCRMLAEGELCELCASQARDDSQLCVVESPADVLAVENSGAYRGRYFVLMGHLSPLDGIGPAELGLHELDLLLAEGRVREVILATNSTVEGEATAHVVSELARTRGLSVTRIAQGVPFGGELEYVDGGTLAHALTGRQQVG
ncbi:MAG: recombination protein RecR [Proteobacteria bacterium]|nr:recombination protein RecR [Pseudomonadota bacterium]MBK9252989.1 recombination protein RecR [Pseudomonadota bacterium]